MRNPHAAAVVLSALTACSWMPFVGRDATAPHGVTAEIAAARTRGDPGARIVVYEFSDFQCPVSARHASEILSRLEESHVRTGKIRYVFRDLPLVGIHPRALPAAIAARCAAEQGRFWEMHRRLLDHQRALGDAELTAHAVALDLDRDRFERCRAETDPHLAAIRTDIATAAENDLEGTPSFLIGLVRDPARGDAGVEIVERVRGVSSYGGFVAVIERATRRRESGAP